MRTRRLSPHAKSQSELIYSEGRLASPTALTILLACHSRSEHPVTRLPLRVPPFFPEIDGTGVISTEARARECLGSFDQPGKPRRGDGDLFLLCANPRSLLFPYPVCLISLSNYHSRQLHPSRRHFMIITSRSSFALPKKRKLEVYSRHDGTLCSIPSSLLSSPSKHQPQHRPSPP
jgi:hypothetical protein